MCIPKRQFVLYCLGHFWIDFSCALLMFTHLRGGGQWLLCILLYNFCAFALQMPIGLLADLLSRNSCVAALGCALAALGWGFAGSPIAAAVLAGVGNGCFHVGAGCDVLQAKRSAALGVFISPGAFGIYLGTLLGKGASVLGWIVIAGLACFGALPVLLDWRRGSLNSGNGPVRVSPGSRLALFCLIVVVVLRSYVGMIQNFEWKQGSLAVAAVCMLVFGKAAGGFLGDAVGMRKAALFSLALSALLFVFGGIPLAGLAGIFLFNMTMPITLWAVSRLLPDAKGLSFGMLSFALFLGFLPTYASLPVPISPAWGCALGAALSLPLLLFGLRKGGIR